MTSESMPGCARRRRRNSESRTQKVSASESASIVARALCSISDDRHLTDGVTGAADRNRCGLAERCHDLHLEAALRDQVQRVGGVSAVEDDLALSKGAPTCDREKPADLLVGDAFEQLPLHPGEPSVGALPDAKSAALPIAEPRLELAPVDDPEDEHHAVCVDHVEHDAIVADAQPVEGVASAADRLDRLPANPSRCRGIRRQPLERASDTAACVGR